jgi:hypothetical protein
MEFLSGFYRTIFFTHLRQNWHSKRDILTERSSWDASYFKAGYPPNEGAPYVEEGAPYVDDGAKMAEVLAGAPYICDGAVPPNLDLLPPEY